MTFAVNKPLFNAKRPPHATLCDALRSLTLPRPVGEAECKHAIITLPFVCENNERKNPCMLMAALYSIRWHLASDIS